MDYFIKSDTRLYINGIPAIVVWKIDENTATCYHENFDTDTYTRIENETIWDILCRKGHNRQDFHKVALESGQFYPRMARPDDQMCKALPGWNPGREKDNNFIAIAKSQLSTLTRQLERICQTVHPEEKTFETFGHDIRNLLILACTEVESHWRGILVANGFNKDLFTTKDYVKLNKAMKLSEYGIVYPSYPWLSVIKPFKDWDSERPTKSLKWYDAYNAVKHDREKNFELAKLGYAFDALAACAIMIVAQFGLEQNAGRYSELQSFFQFLSVPAWSFSDVYIYHYDKPEWSEVSFPF